MKYLSYLLLVLVGLGLCTTSCKSNDDEIGQNSTSGVTVSMLVADTIYGENQKKLLNIPFEVKGERNGYVTVTCVVDEYGGSVAMEDVHYLLTSYTVNVAPEDSIGYFEIKMVDDVEENENREFIVTLDKVYGAEITGMESTVVTIKDNDSDPYERMGGAWTMMTSNGPKTVSLNNSFSGQAGYYEYYMISDMFEGTDVKALFSWNPATKEGSITIEYGQKLEDQEDSSLGVGEGFLAWINGPGYIADNGSATFTWGEEHNVMTLSNWAGEDDYPGAGADFYYLLHFSAGYYLGATQIEGVTSFSR